MANFFLFSFAFQLAGILDLEGATHVGNLNCESKLQTKSKTVIVSLFAGLVILLSGVHAAYVAGSGTSIPITGSPSGAVFDPSNGDIYVSSYASSLVAVISSSTNTVVDNLNVNGPTQLAFDSANGDIYAVGFATGVVYAISGSTNLAVANISASGIQGLAFDPSNGDVYGALSNGSVVVINGQTNSVTATVSTGATNTLAVGVDATNGNVFVTSENLTASSNTVYVISGSTNSVTGTVAVGVDPDSVAFDSSNGEVFVANGMTPSNNNAGTISVINGATVSLTDSITAVGGSPRSLLFDPATGNIYASLRGGSIAVIDGTTNALVTQLSTSAQSPALALDTTTGNIYAPMASGATAGVVSVISPASSSSTSSSSTSTSSSSTPSTTSSTQTTSSSPTTTSQTTSSIPPSTSSVTSATSAAASTSKSTSSATAMSGNYIEIVAINFAVILVLVSLIITARKKHIAPN
jgi:YVTN family beta-propeller protein